MITCDHCKLPTPAGMVSCQHCGKPLTQTMSDGNAPVHDQGMAAPVQPELPAWLETLRSGEQPAMSASEKAGASAFLAADLVDEGMLPSWMRPENAEHVDNTPSDAHQARRPASAPAPNTDSAYPPARGMAASSLIDEQSLPFWIQGKEEGSQYPGQENISAASLVQPGALPDWIRGMESQPPASMSPTSPTSSSPVQYPQPLPPAQPIAAHDLIDQQSLPGWMAGQNTPPPADGQGLAASSLLDARALPEWLRFAEEQPQGMAPNQAQQDFAENPRQGTFGVPPRPDFMRVPSRPRGEMGYAEESEVAANTFASMLGVASVAPNYPGQQPNDAFGHSQPPAQYQQGAQQAQTYGATGIPGPGVPPGSVRDPQNQQGQLGQAVPSMPPPAYPGMTPNQGYAPNQAQYPTGYQMGNMPGVSTQPPLANNTAGKQPGAMTSNDPSNANKKPAKRGFLSTILDWFPFSR